jgi:FixJ family two-component response regulator
MTEAKSDSKLEIFVVDDDQAVRQTLTAVFTAAGHGITCFADGAALLAATRQQTPSCIILDVHIPGRSGLDILKELNADDYPAPIFIMSGQGDIAMAVDAIRHGALDFIEKPFRGSVVVQKVREAIGAMASRRSSGAEQAVPDPHFPGREPLTRREREVLMCLTSGASNKEAARQLGIGPRTVEYHRARLMEKLGARNVADLVRIVMSEGRSSAKAK